MKTKGSIINTLLIVTILTVAFYVKDTKCQEKANNINAQHQYEYAEKNVNEIRDDTMKDDKNIGVEILELLIKRNLYYKYSKLDPEELEEMLEKRR
jgi:hypothetical protein